MSLLHFFHKYIDFQSQGQDKIRLAKQKTPVTNVLKKEKKCAITICVRVEWLHDLWTFLKFIFLCSASPFGTTPFEKKNCWFYMTSPNYTLFRFWSTLCIHSIRSTERTHFPKVKEQSAQSSDFLYLATNRLSQQHLDNLPWVYTTNLKHCTSTITNTYTIVLKLHNYFDSKVFLK